MNGEVEPIVVCQRIGGPEPTDESRIPPLHQVARNAARGRTDARVNDDAGLIAALTRDEAESTAAVEAAARKIDRSSMMRANRGPG